MKVSILVAHAPWPPHFSGYSADIKHQEHFFSHEVAQGLNVAIASAGLDIDAELLEIGDEFDCFASCVGGMKGKTVRRLRKKQCASYRAGHAAMNNAAADSDLVLEYHLDFWNHPKAMPMGPMCMVKDSPTASAWSHAFLSSMESHRNTNRRWKSKYDGVIDVAVSEGYGKIGLLETCRDAVIIEAAVSNHPGDIQWLDSDQAVPQVIDASLTALSAICGG